MQLFIIFVCAGFFKKIFFNIKKVRNIKNLKSNAGDMLNSINKIDKETLIAKKNMIIAKKNMLISVIVLIIIFIIYFSTFGLENLFQSFLEGIAGYVAGICFGHLIKKEN